MTMKNTPETFGGQPAPFKRAAMLCNGRLLPVMGCKITPEYYTPCPEPHQFRPGEMPEELRTKARKQEAGQWMANACYDAELRYKAAFEKWKEECKRNPQWDVSVEITLLGCVWRGGFVGPWKPTIEDVKGGRIGPAMELELADGRKIPGRVESLPAAEINAQKAILDEEREPGGGNAKVLAILEASAAREAENHRLLHRTLRKVENVPPLVNKLNERNSPALAEMAAKLTQKIRLDAEQWDTFYALIMEGKTQTQVAIERGMGKKDAYKISREWAEIKRKFLEAGEPVPEKITLHNAVMGEDGVVFKKPTKGRIRRS